ncbi:MAG: hypothetical protein JSR24_16075 [Proteobacteria bacterium]|nr:hypothetical protein [Pseudomonadota bacterium]
MADDLTNEQIALLYEIGEYDPLEATDDRKRDLRFLLAGGYVKSMEEGPSGAVFQLTAKGSAFLSARGAGPNEA